MADDKKPVEPAKPEAKPGLSIRSVNIVQDPYNKSPNGMPMDIVELVAFPLGEGNSIHWMQWADCLRFRCERGKADAVLEGLGLKPKVA